MSASIVCVPWHKPEVRDAFLQAWRIEPDDPRVVLQEDKGWKSCAKTKNMAIETAVERLPRYIIVIDSDCYPSAALNPSSPLDHFIDLYEQSFYQVDVPAFKPVTTPRSRGTPHLHENRVIKRDVCAVMGFWEFVGDYDAPSQLVYGQHHSMEFDTDPIFGKYFAFSGMNCAFRAGWWPIFKFIDVPRYDDIWMGWILQRMAYNQNLCFRLDGPKVVHSRQSNVWQNLAEESKYAEINETLWRRIAESKSDDFLTLRALLPV